MRNMTSGVARVMGQPLDLVHRPCDEFEWHHCMVAEPRGYGFVARIVQLVVARMRVIRSDRFGRLIVVSMCAALASCQSPATSDLTAPTESTSAIQPSVSAAPALSFRQVSASWEHTCGVTVNNRAYCWGRNHDGELGAGTSSPEQPDSPYPIGVVGSLNFRHVSAGYGHSCGVTTDSLAYCWGNNQFGQLGRATMGFGARPFPKQVVGGLRFTQVSAGASHTCGVSYPEQRVYCWGINENGQLGDGTKTLRTAPVRVVGDYRFYQVTAGNNHTCGITLANELFCWGANELGQIGDSTKTLRLRPVQVSPARRWRRVDAGGFHTCAVTTTSMAFCWGYGQSGQLGRGDRFLSKWPRQVLGGGLTWASIDAGEYHTCGVTTQNQAYCWGEATSSKLGLGDTDGFDRLLPAPVVGGLSFRQVTAAFEHTCGVTTTGPAYCWGWSGDGRLGTGTENDTRRSPAPVAGPI